MANLVSRPHRIVSLPLVRICVHVLAMSSSLLTHGRVTKIWYVQAAKMSRLISGWALLFLTSSAARALLGRWNIFNLAHTLLDRLLFAS